MSTPDVPSLAPWGKWDKAALQLLFGGGAFFAALMLVATVIGIVSELATGQRLLTLTTHDALPAAADTGSATLMEGNYDSATVVVSGLSTAASALLTVGDIVMVLGNSFTVAAFLYLIWRLLRREPFQRSLTWTFVAAGSVLILGAIIGQTLTLIGSVMVTGELGSDLDGSGFWPIAATIDMTPIGLGFMLMLVASAFEYAQKLAAEARGLV